MARNGKDALYNDLKRRILTMELPPGTVLDESRISAEYGISRTPLRDIYRQLAGEGYLLLRDNRGAIVSPMDHRTMRHFFMTAPLIYASVARLAAQNATKPKLDELRTAQREFRIAVDNNLPDDMVYWNDRFHHIIGEMADNPYLMASLQRLLIDHARIGQTFWRRHAAESDAKIDAAADHHDRFIDLIEAGQEEEVVALTLEHWALSRDHLELYVRPDPLPISVGPD